MNNQEIWKDVIGYEGIYQVSNLGRVKSLSRKRFNGKGYYNVGEIMLSPRKNTKGYLTVALHNQTNPKTISVHRLVAKAYIGDSFLTVDHINGIKTDNRAENLRYVTNRENILSYHSKYNKYTGTYYEKKHNKYRAQITVNTKAIWLGLYDTVQEAHQAYLNYKTTHNIN
jgi:hypothetical protein